MTFRLDLTQGMQRYVGFWEAEIAKTLREFSRGIQSAVDVGAAEGWYTCYFLTKTAANRVLAFEPSDDCGRELVANVALTGAARDRFRLVPRPVGRGNDGTVALGEFVQSLVPPCLMKIDVDGAELDVLRGAMPLLERRVSFRWIIETHSAELERECADLLRASGYTVTIIPNAWWRMIVHDERPIAHNRWLSAIAQE